jgi:hypothetical protein
MSRLERPEAKNANPATKFLEWKSNEKCFEFYDKENKEKVLVDLPLKIAFLEHYHTVKGFHEPTQTGIYSNEVYSIGYEEMTIKTFKGLEIFEGIYKAGKDKIKKAGANYHRSIYGVFENGDIVNIALKGSSIGGIKPEKAKDGKHHNGYSDFVKNNEHDFEKKWIVIDKVAEGKSGSITYSIPVFSMTEDFSEDEDLMVISAARELQEFVNSRKDAKTVSAEEQQEPELIGKDDY